MSATICIRASTLIPQPDGTFAVAVTHGVLSVQPDGSLQTRPADQVGPWEKGTRDGSRLVFSDPAYPTGSYALLVVGE